jgi:hypothetical protein
MLATIIAVAGGLVCTGGSIMTAYGANNTLKALRSSLGAHDLTITRYVTGQHIVPLFAGLPRQTEKAMAHDAKLVKGGVKLLVAGFILQTLSVLFSSLWPYL